MTDKTAIEKARSALCRAGSLLDNQGYPTGYIKEALAALDTVKPAEKYCIRCGYAIPEDFSICTKCGLPADAEKPAEENYMVLLDAIFDAITENGIMNHPTNGMFLTSESIDACLPILQRFAESYHAERCAACKERK